MVVDRIRGVMAAEGGVEIFDAIHDHTMISRFDDTSVIVICGAGCTDISQEIIARCRFTKLILVEANPEAARELESYFSGNGSVTVIDAAVGGDRKDNVDFYLSANREACSLNRSISAAFGFQEGRDRISVAMITVRDIIDRFRLKKIDLLVMDIEGAECDIVDSFGAGELGLIDQISVEFHDFIDPSLAARVLQCVEKLRSAGFIFVSKPGINKNRSYYDCLFYKNKLNFNIVIFKRIVCGFPRLLFRVAMKIAKKALMVGKFSLT